MPFDFNLQSSLLMPFFLQGIVFTFLLLVRSKKENRISDLFLSIIILLNAFKVAFWMLGYAGWYDSHDSFTSFMFYFPFNNILLIGPLFYFYFLSVTNVNFKFQKKHLQHFVLPAFWILFILFKFSADFIFYYPFPVIEDTQYGTKGPFAEIDKSIIVILINYISFFYYATITLKEFKYYKLYINQNFSDTETINFNWLQNLLFAITGGVIVMFTFTIVSIFNDGLTYFQDWYAYFILGIILYYISINGYFTNLSRSIQLQYKEHSGLEEILVIEKDFIKKEPVQNTETTEMEVQKQRLKAFMITEKPYANPELTLNTLAKQMKTNSTYLSKIINEGFNQNFNDYINKHRIEDVLLRLKNGDYKKQTLISIAFDAGFNSKTTFNRSFKKEINKTPIEFVKSINQ